MLGSLPSFRRRLLDWYERHRRDLPWRLPPVGSKKTGSKRPDPYHVLVSELMLQQTQVATVIPYFHRFLARFPTLAALAQADAQDVLRLWQGLGYYSRARNLQEAARITLRDYGGRLPADLGELLKLPGIGRYTAGAVASLAFGRRAPILDGNVARVLCRLDRIEADPGSPQTRDILWGQAEAILPRQRIGDFNSALMELGALVCTPRSPQCLVCPVRAHCRALAGGMQEKIPAPRKRPLTPLLHRWVFCIEHRGRWLIEQRPSRGRWAGMWQFVTLETGDAMTDAMPNAAYLRRQLQLRTTSPQLIGRIAHALTHRRYEFEVFTCKCLSLSPVSRGEGRGEGRILSARKCPSPQPSPPSTGERESAHSPRQWVALKNLADYPLPRPHLKVAELLAKG